MVDERVYIIKKTKWDHIKSHFKKAVAVHISKGTTVLSSFRVFLFILISASLIVEKGGISVCVCPCTCTCVSITYRNLGIFSFYSLAILLCSLTRANRLLHSFFVPVVSLFLIYFQQLFLYYRYKSISFIYMAKYISQPIICPLTLLDILLLCIKIIC